jgi:uncharacterized membrane protein YedE/YeeE
VTISRWLRQKEWSSYGAGVALGVVVTVSMALHHRLSGAGAYQELAAYLGRAIAPRALYWRHIVTPAIGWDVWVVVGSLLGSFVFAGASGSFRLRTMPDRLWDRAFGTSVPLRWGLAFVGSLLTAYGAGIAGGCTASLAVSGGAALAPGAFAFMAGMFAGGIPTAFLALGRRRASQ